ncbi:hypothetical protein D3C73_1154660 [compost metagenome]
MEASQYSSYKRSSCTCLGTARAGATGRGAARRAELPRAGGVARVPARAFGLAAWRVCEAAGRLPFFFAASAGGTALNRNNAAMAAARTRGEYGIKKLPWNTDRGACTIRARTASVRAQSACAPLGLQSAAAAARRSAARCSPR